MPSTPFSCSPQALGLKSGDFESGLAWKSLELGMRSECKGLRSEIWREAEEFCGTAFLNEGILCVNGKTRGGNGAAIYQMTRSRGSADPSSSLRLCRRLVAKRPLKKLTLFPRLNRE
jgi:hypothetical protein